MFVEVDVEGFLTGVALFDCEPLPYFVLVRDLATDAYVRCDWVIVDDDGLALPTIELSGWRERI